MESLYLFDGNALIHRAYHAYPANLTTSDGTQVNAVYGFTRMMLKILADQQPSHVAVAFDTGAPTFRHVEFAAYKEGRPEMDQELVDQVPLIHEVVAAFNIPIFEFDGYEADDVLGTLAYQAVDCSPTLAVTIVTGDRDILQLLRDRIAVLMPKNGFTTTVFFDEKKFTAKYEFTPEQLVEYKALRGDPSDNIPGVRGIGDKTAKSLIKQYKTVEEVYKHLGELSPSVARKLAQGAEDAGISKRLAKIVVDVPLSFDLQACVTHDFDREKAKELFERLEFRSLISKIPGDGPKVGQESLF